MSASTVLIMVMMMSAVTVFSVYKLLRIQVFIIILSEVWVFLIKKIKYIRKGYLVFP